MDITDYWFCTIHEVVQGSMGEIIHRCLHCNTVSYEKEERLWHCPECGFEWETIGS